MINDDTAKILQLFREGIIDRFKEQASLTRAANPNATNDMIRELRRPDEIQRAKDLAADFPASFRAELVELVNETLSKL